MRRRSRPLDIPPAPVDTTAASTCSPVVDLRAGTQAPREGVHGESFISAQLENGALRGAVAETQVVRHRIDGVTGVTFITRWTSFLFDADNETPEGFVPRVLEPEQVLEWVLYGVQHAR